MNDGEVGYWFEEKVRLALDKCLRTMPIKAIRLYDSKSAGAMSGGNFLPEQPGDMVWMVSGVGLLVELKASDATRSLNIGYKKKMKPAQIGGARLWLRAGGSSAVIFCGRQEGVIELWHGADVVEAWRNGWPRIRAAPLEEWIFGDQADVESTMVEVITFLVEKLKHEGTYLHRPAYRGEPDGEHDA